MFTKHSLDLRLARDLELGNEAREPHRPSREGVLSFPAGTKRRKKQRKHSTIKPILSWCIVETAHMKHSEDASSALLYEYESSCAWVEASERLSCRSRVQTHSCLTLCAVCNVKYFILN